MKIFKHNFFQFFNVCKKSNDLAKVKMYSEFVQLKQIMKILPNYSKKSSKNQIFSSLLCKKSRSERILWVESEHFSAFMRNNCRS